MSPTAADGHFVQFHFSGINSSRVVHSPCSVAAAAPGGGPSPIYFQTHLKVFILFVTHWHEATVKLLLVAKNKKKKKRVVGGGHRREKGRIADGNRYRKHLSLLL